MKLQQAAFYPIMRYHRIFAPPFTNGWCKCYEKCRVLERVVADMIHKEKKPTNADKIRAMTDEELAEWLQQTEGEDKQMNNLRNLRKTKGLTIPKLSELTGIPVRTIEDYESEKSQITYYHRLNAFCKALDCDIDLLMTKEEKCFYDGTSAIMWLVQQEDGVCVEIVEDDEDCKFDSLFKDVISRNKALELLKYMKEHEEVNPFFEEYRNTH